MKRTVMDIHEKQTQQEKLQERQGKLDSELEFSLNRQHFAILLLCCSSGCLPLIAGGEQRRAEWRQPIVSVASSLFFLTMYVM